MYNTNTINAATGTAIALGIFKSKSSALKHFKTAKRQRLPIQLFKNGLVDNFNPDRLSKTPYPSHNRPRGAANLASVRFHRKTIRRSGSISSPVWIYKENSKLTMLDGVHRVVASYLEDKRNVPAFIVSPS